MPQPGAQMPTGFLYIEVTAGDIRQKTPTFGTFATGEPYTSIEHYLKGRCVLSVAKKDYHDSSRIYRLPNTAIRAFPVNPCDETERFLPVGNKRFIILELNPNADKTAKTTLWIPLGP